MIEENNKKKSGWRQATTMFFVLLLVGLFLFAEKAFAYTGDYNKLATSTLTAAEWNNLLNDFVAIRANGNVGIGTTLPGTDKLVVAGGRLVTIGQNIYSGSQIHAAGTGTNYLYGKLGVGLPGSGGVTSFTVSGNAAIGSSYTNLNNVPNPPINGLIVEGNVGIGTTDPTLLFQVGSRGGMSSDGVFYWGQTLTNNNRGRLTWDTDRAMIDTPLRLDLQTGGSTRLTVNSSGNVGIGTVDPGVYKLNVAGAGLFSSYLNVSSNIYAQTFQPTGVTANWIARLRDNAYKFSFQDASSTERMVITGGGNVGIGTTNPSTLLSVAGSIAGNPQPVMSLDTNNWFTFAHNSGYGSINFFARADGSNYLNTHATVRPSQISGGDGSLIFATAATNAGSGTTTSLATRMTINPLGNVGIGTTDPGSYKLNVNGSLRVGGAATFNSSVTLSTFSGTAGRLVAVDASGNLYATSSSVILPEGTVTLPSGTNGQTLRYNNGSWIANSNIYNNGTNVGIGTSNPVVKLVLQQGDQPYVPLWTAPTGDIAFGIAANTSAISGLDFKNFHTSGQVRLMARNDQNDYLVLNTFGSENTASFFGQQGKDISTIFSYGTADGDKKLVVGTFNVGDLILGTGNIERMRIASDGDIGIGTTNPGTDKLSVDGRIVTLNTKDVFPSGQIHAAGTGTNYLYGKLGVSLPGSGGVTNLAVSGNAAIGQTYMNALNVPNPPANGLIVEGNVGIGTANPTTGKLVIAGDIDLPNNNAWRYIKNSSTKGGLRLGTGNSSGVYTDGIEISSGGGYVKLNHNTTVSGNLYATGRIGIGTTTPKVNLHVFGRPAIRWGFASSYSTWYGQVGNYGYSEGQDSLGGVQFLSQRDSGAANSGFYTFSTQTGAASPVARLVINYNGNVGIGTTDPGTYKLNVDGSLRVGSAATFNSAVTLTSLSGTAGRLIAVDASGNLYATSSSVATGLPTASTNGATLRSNGTSWLSNTTIYNNGTNVGIGTTTPAAKFHAVAVNGTDNTGYNFIFDNQDVSATHSNGLLVKGGANANSANIFAAQDYSGNTDFVIRGDGNVGIGTTNPGTDKLSVDGRIATLNTKDIYSSGQIHAIGTGSNYLTGNLGVGLTGTGGVTKLTVSGNAAIGSSYINATNVPNPPANGLIVEGNVGIGTTNPNSKLQVSGGNIQLDNNQQYTIKDSTGVARRIALLNNSNILAFGDAGNVATYFYSGGNLVFAPNGDVRFPGDGVWKSGGNVGIGTTDPGTYKLNVNGSLRVANAATFNSAVTLTSFSGTAGRLVAVDASGNLYATSTSVILPEGTITLPSGTNGQTLRYNSGSWVANSNIYNNGTNVGIGTTTPADKLQVYGNAFLGKISGYPFKSLWSWDSNNTGYYSGIGYQKSDGTNQKLFAWWKDNVLETNINSVLNVATITNTFNGTAPNTGRTIGASISASGISYFNGGSVGIGTTNPGTDKLSVDGRIVTLNTKDVFPSGQIHAAGTGTNYLYGKLGVSLPGSGGVTNLAVSGNAAIGQTYMNAANVPNPPANGLIVEGNVGIGTASPTRKLDVSGDVLFNNNALIASYSPASNIDHIWHDDASAGGAPGTWHFVSDSTYKGVGNSRIEAGHSWMTANQNNYFAGSVGIGTTDPGSYKLNVNGNTNITGNLNVTGTISGNSTITGTINATNVSSGEFGVTGGGGNFSFGATVPGNVGIGTLSPATRLDINYEGVINTTTPGHAKYGLHFSGQGTADYANGITWNGGSTNSNAQAGIYVQGSGAYGTKMYFATTNAYVTGAQTRMMIDQAGSVGIGTTNLTNTLTVAKLNNTNDSTLKIVSNGLTDEILHFTNSTVNNTWSIGRRNTANTFEIAYNANVNGGIRSGNVLTILNNGNVGINTTDPSEAKLVINAGTGVALKAYGHGVFTGTLQTQTGSDFAEEFATTKDLEPGTVVVMDDNGYKSVKPSTKSYDKTVVGIVSNNPSIIAGKIDSQHKAVIAMMGVVKVKVTSVNGAISKGDLLTTSNIIGYAMKTDGSKPGTVIGKALEDLKGSKGEINVLVNLQ